MSQIETTPNEKFSLLKEIVSRVKDENSLIKDPDIIKKSIEELRVVKLGLKNKSASAFYSDMKKIIAEKKKDGEILFPSKKPSN